MLPIDPAASLVAVSIALGEEIECNICVPWFIFHLTTRPSHRCLDRTRRTDSRPSAPSDSRPSAPSVDSSSVDSSSVVDSCSASPLSAAVIAVDAAHRSDAANQHEVFPSVVIMAHRSRGNSSRPRTLDSLGNTRKLLACYSPSHTSTLISSAYSSYIGAAIVILVLIERENTAMRIKIMMSVLISLPIRDRCSRGTYLQRSRYLDHPRSHIHDRTPRTS